MLSPQMRTPSSITWRANIAQHPVCEPIDFTLMQTTFRVAVDTDTFEVKNRIATARRVIETYLRRPLVQTVYDLFLDDEMYVQNEALSPWITALYEYSRVIEVKLPYPPMISVMGVWIRDDTGTETLVDPSVYTVSTANDPARIRLNRNQQWGEHRGFEGFRIRFAAGYAIPFLVDSNGYIVANNHGLTEGDTVRVSSQDGVLPGSLQDYTDYTVAAVAGNQISLNDPNGDPVTGNPNNMPAVTTYSNFLGVIPADIIRILIDKCSMDVAEGSNRWAAKELADEEKDVLAVYQAVLM